MFLPNERTSLRGLGDWVSRLPRQTPSVWDLGKGEDVNDMVLAAGWKCTS
jgi:hypothetical protein